MKDWLNKKVKVFENIGKVIYQWSSGDGHERLVVEFENNSTKKNSMVSRRYASYT